MGPGNLLDTFTRQLQTDRNRRRSQGENAAKSCQTH